MALVLARSAEPEDITAPERIVAGSS